MNALTQSLLFVVILIGCALLGAFIYQLMPVLTPFIIAALIAYLIDPLVEKLNQGKWKVPRTVSVVGGFTLVILIFFGCLLFLVPAIHRQMLTLAANMPAIFEWIQNKIIPELVRLGFASEEVGLEELKSALMSHSTQAQAMAKWLGKTLFHSGTTIARVFMNVFIIFIATFYLLRDWRKILASIKALLPVKVAPLIIRITQQCDMVLATFIRGQLSVMVALAAYYGLALALLGVHFSMLLGLLAGILSIVPYLGSIIGLGGALLVAYLQFDTWWPIVGVLGIFGLGHILEGFVLTPLLIGDKLGLHPVAVIFAVLAGGHLLGFVGVVLALPVAAILVVLLRELLNKLPSAPVSVGGGVRGQ